MGHVCMLVQALHEDMRSTEGQLTSLRMHHHQVLPYLSPVGAMEINAKQESLISTWQMLGETVITRTQQLSKALLQQQDFQDRWNEFEKWLTRVQKRHDALREIYADEVQDTTRKLEVCKTLLLFSLAYFFPDTAKL